MGTAPDAVRLALARHDALLRAVAHLLCRAHAHNFRFQVPNVRFEERDLPASPTFHLWGCPNASSPLWSGSVRQRGGGSVGAGRNTISPHVRETTMTESMDRQERMWA